METPLLELKDVSMMYPGTLALDGVSFRIRQGEVHALIGENGAGKSTLVKIMSGVLTPTKGRIFLEGEEVAFGSPLDAQKAGIAVIHQEAAVFPDLSVAENIFMSSPVYAGRLPFLSWKEMHRRAADILEELGVPLETRTPVKDLSTAERQLVEIAKALTHRARIVIMDEPTSSLSAREVEDLFSIIRDLKASGTGVVFISHKFEEIEEIADHFTVLRDGQYVGEGEVRETSREEIIRMMIGRKIEQYYPERNSRPGEVVLEVKNLSREGVFHDVSFEVRRGEILGFFGLVGSGRTEVMRCIVGVDAWDSGEVRFRGEAVRFRSPREAMGHGIVYVPEDRQLQGCILNMSICENITLPLLSALHKRGWIDRERERRFAEEYAKRLEVKAPHVHVWVNALSGGNQQKVVLAKWLAAQPSLLILDEPTRGIDIATKAAVHTLVADLAAQGLAVLLVSSELPEVLGMADRVVVFHEGAVTGTFDARACTSEEIMRAALGHGERSAG